MRALVPAAVLLVALVSGCRRNTGAIVDAREPIADARVPGLYPCTEGGRGVIDLDPHKPLTLLVHGCSSSGARFKTLARVFEASGQQALCMNYNDRDSLNTSATQLAEALTFLQGRLDPQELTILGHSQGGLVARRALQADLPHPLQTRPGFTYRLVTVSTPFAGIRSSADCGKTWLHLLSLSVTVAVCLAVTGNKWTEIYPGSPFMRNPAPVSVTRHLQVQTDERDTCRTPGPDGRCRVDDFVFGLDEQASDVIARDAAWDTVTLKAGHAAVVGENGVPPRLLIETLQREGILLPAPPEKQGEVDALLERLWADAGEGGPPAAVRRRLHEEAKQHLDTVWILTLDGQRLGLRQSLLGHARPEDPRVETSGAEAPRPGDGAATLSVAARSPFHFGGPRGGQVDGVGSFRVGVDLPHDLKGTLHVQRTVEAPEGARSSRAQEGEGGAEGRAQEAEGSARPP